jgi:hypothetical protein
VRALWKYPDAAEVVRGRDAARALVRLRAFCGRITGFIRVFTKYPDAAEVVRGRDAARALVRSCDVDPIRDTCHGAPCDVV